MNGLSDEMVGTGAAYRAYLIGESGRIASAVDVLAENDDDAVRQAQAIEYGGAVELWDRGRVIFRHAKGEHRAEIVA